MNDATTPSRGLDRRSFLTKSAIASALAATSLSGRAAAPVRSSFGEELETAVDRAPRSSAPSALKITDIKCGYTRNGHSLFVKVHTNQGIWGCGEAVDASVGTYHLVKLMGERIKGKSPLNVNRLFEDVRRSGFFEGAQSGIYISVLSAVETALWDLVGKALGMPVYQLLGGKFRDRVRVYCDTGAYRETDTSPDAFGKSAKKAVDMGFTAVKYDIDERNDPNKYDAYNWTASQGELERMHNQIAGVRKAVGPKIDICVDMHGRYDVTTGRRVAKMMEPLNLLFLEEPIPAENPEAYRQIRESSNTPICAGENHYLAHGFRKLLEIGAVDIIMPDLQKAGGLGEGQRIANLANLYYVPFAPHMVASYLGAMASSHVCASVPNFLILEWQIYFHEEPMFKEIVTFDGPMVKDGFIPLSEKPGIGVEINEEGMRKYAPKDVPFFV